MSDPPPPADPTADALADSLDVPTPAEWREAVRVVKATFRRFTRAAPVMEVDIEAYLTKFEATVEPVALFLSLQQPAPPQELPRD